LRVIRSIEEIKLLKYRRSQLTIGRFQGLHRGHRLLIEALNIPREQSPKIVVSFDPAPEDVLRGTRHKKLFTIDDKILVLKELGVDCVFLIPFSLQLASMDPTNFAKTYIFDAFDPALIVVGYDFAFGKDRKGNVETLKNLKNDSTKIEQIAPLLDGPDVISTSLIRTEIQSGNVQRAHELLSRPYYLTGTVVHGEKRGRKIGFPTINLFYHEEAILPAVGVYFVRVAVDGESYCAVCNIGTNPTFTSGQEVKWECHLLDFDRDIYNASVKVTFYERLRDERKFSSKEELIATIQKDISRARILSKSLPND
jgi:riboflavin kinase / FMN adenylyltransferase